MSTEYDWSPLTNALLLAPLYRTQLVVQTQDLIPSIPKETPSRGIFSFLKEICSKESILYLFRGSMPLLMLGLSNNILRWKFVREAEEITRPNFRYLAATPDVVTSAAIIAWNFITHPIEVLRVRMCCDNFGVPEKLYGIRNTISNLVKTEGIRTLYRGYVPATAYYIIQQDLILARDEYQHSKPSTIAKRIARDFVLYPLLVVSHRMIVDSQNWRTGYQNMGKCVRATYNKLGIYGFYRGFWGNIFMNLYRPWLINEKGVKCAF